MKRVLLPFLFFAFANFILGQDIIYHSDAMADDEFGYTVAVHGDFAAVSAERSDALGQQSGAVYIYHYDGTQWNETQKITAFDGVAWDYFGAGLSMHGNYLVIGNYFDDDNGMNSGSAYIYKRNGMTWDFETKVSADDGSSADWLGWQVDNNDEYAVLGARGDDAASNLNDKAGAAYIFQNNNDGTWTQLQKLTRDMPNNVDEFGYDVAIDGDYVFVGAPRQEHSQGHRGMVYIYKKNTSGTFDLVQTLENETGASTDQFGLRLDASAGRLIVSSEKSAKVFVLQSGIWNFEIDLFPNVNASSVKYVDVRISNGFALINNYISALQGPPSTHLFSFQTGAWQLVETFEGTSFNQRFSHSFDLHSGKVIVGSPRNDDQGDNAGAIFSFSYDDPTTSIKHISKENFINLYPNPVQDILNLKSTKELTELRIFNHLGQLIYTSRSNETSIPVSHFPKGNYVIQIKTADKEILIEKFLKF